MRSKVTPAIKHIVGQTTVILLLGALLALTVNHFRTDGIALVDDWSPAARLQAAAGSDDMVIPMEQAIAFHETRGAVFVDARSPAEFAEGHIAGAINVPWENAFDYIDRFFAAVPDDSTVIIVYCDGEGCLLSEELVRLLRDMGYANARVLVNGWTLWRRHGYPVAK